MPEHLRALVFILVLVTLVFAVARKPACAMALDAKDFDRRRNLWFALVFIVFLAHHYWAYIIASGILLFYSQRREQNKLALYLFVLLAVPPIPGEISGMGLMKTFFQIDYVRLLALAILLPAYLALRGQAGVEPFGRFWADKLLIAYLALDVLLMFEHRTVTSILRDGVFYAFVDIFLPYYVASRALRTVERYRDALMSYVVAAMVLSPVLFLELRSHWLLYESLDRALGSPWGWNAYLVRGANIRATGTIGHAIAAGYVIAVALGLFLYARKVVPNRTMWNLGFALLVAGLIGPLSRAPWVGSALMVLIFIAAGPKPMVSFAKLGLAGLVVIPVLLVTPYGATIIDHLPFVGTVDARNVVGRQILAEVSYQVFWQNPLLGKYDFVLAPELQALRGDDGQVDLVNTYVIVALGRGAVGLAMFVGFFLVAIYGVMMAMRSIADREDERHYLGRSLLSVLVGILFIIATVGPVLRIPLLYWLVAGLGVGYSAMVAGTKLSAVSTSPAGARGAFARADGDR